MDEKLTQFIEHARSKGLDHATIRMLLLSAGWKEKEVSRALIAQALDVPIPTPPDVGGAREVFLYLISFAALYTFVGYALTLIFSYIDVKLPDAATTPYAQLQAEASRGAIPEAMAAVFVTFPVLLWVSRILIREMRVAPDKAASPVRRMLTYLTLFAAAMTIAIDLATLIAFFLQGEVTARFLLKVGAVLVVAGAGFVYYFKSLKMAPEEHRTTGLHRAFGWSATIVVAISMTVGMITVGSPSTERLRRFDAQRAADVKLISEEIFNISVGANWRNPGAPLAIKQPLPKSLNELAATARMRRPRIADPATGTPYEYQPLSESRFQICATFNLPRDEVADVVWNHPAGRHCFEFDTLNPWR